MRWTGWKLLTNSTINWQAVPTTGKQPAHPATQYGVPKSAWKPGSFWDITSNHHSIKHLNIYP